MLKIKNVEVMNMKNALRGMRNPLESWAKSDSGASASCGGEMRSGRGDALCDAYYYEKWVIGEEDLKLAQRLISAGSDHSKFMRQILVSMDISAPLYWWKEMDTYKVATVSNSCSTMHKLASTPITRECFSFDDVDDLLDSPGQDAAGPDGLPNATIGDSQDKIIDICEGLRRKYLETENKNYWRALIQLLPESWNQMRTWSANYATLRNIYFARKNHRLTEWHTFCRVIEELPCGENLICHKG
jgi:hypothetical protein